MNPIDFCIMIEYICFLIAVQSLIIGEYTASVVFGVVGGVFVMVALLMVVGGKNEG